MEEHLKKIFAEIGEETPTILRKSLEIFLKKFEKDSEQKLFKQSLKKFLHKFTAKSMPKSWEYF